MPTDLLVRNEGTIFLLTPVSDNGKAWVEEHVSDDHQEWCGAIVVEHRYITDIVAGAQADGLKIL